jgi:M6 family metalloprotease-like protein
MTRFLFVARAAVTGMSVLPLFGFAQVTNGVTNHAAARATDMDCVAQAPVTGASLFPSEIHVKILLVEFSDVQCAKSDDGQTPRYTARDFENLLGSEGTYASPRMFSPDGDEVHGSMNDYFRAMSGGKLRLRASVVNRLNPDGTTPTWLRLAETKAYYHGIPWFSCPFFKKAKQAATDSGLDVSTPVDVRLVIIYSGNLYHCGGGLNPNAGERVYIMSELQGIPYGQEVAAATFSRIGTHCHEFAHTIGVGHTSGSRADLMESGTRNGSVTGNAPAPLNPIARVGLGWATCVDVAAEDTGAIDLEYSLTSPTVYRWKNSNGDEFYVENRRFDKTMRLGDTEVPDYSHAAFFPPAWPHGMLRQGILVWRKNTKGDSKDPGYSREGLIYASGRYGSTYPENTLSETDDGVPFPGVCGVMSLSPWSDPRNPYVREPNSCDSSRSHYTLYVPNTKGGTRGGFDIISEDRERGTFRVVFRIAAPPNPAVHNQSTVSTATAGNSQRKLFREPGGRLQVVFESGGEIFYRVSPNEGRTWDAVRQVSNGNGGNAAPSITVAGSTTLVVWQVKASGAMCYAIHYARSTDRGTSWSQVASFGLITNCSVPGPVPTVAGAQSGHATVLCRNGREVCGMTSSDEGKTWTAMPAFPGSLDKWGAPSVAMSRSAAGTPQVHVVVADNAGNGASGIHYNVFDCGTRTWGVQAVLSEILPASYADSRNPSVAATDGGPSGSGTVHVAWDALDVRSDAERVVVHRVARGGVFVPSYSIIVNGSTSSPSVTCTGGHSAILLCERSPERGLWKLNYDGSTWRGDPEAYATGGAGPQTSVGSDTVVSLWTDGDTAPFRLNTRVETPVAAAPHPSWRYARSLALTRAEPSAGLQVSFGSCATIQGSGAVRNVLLCSNEVIDSACGATSLLSLMQTQPFSLDDKTDSIQIEFRLAGRTLEALFPSGHGSVAFELVGMRSGSVLGTFAQRYGSEITENCSGITRMSVSLARVYNSEEEDSCLIRLSLTGLCTEGAGAALGHIYSRGCNCPVTTCCGSFEEAVTAVAGTDAHLQRLTLHQNYPNPFNATTTIRYELPVDGDVLIEVYNAIGQRVATPVNGTMKQGRHEVILDGTGLASGVYLYRISLKPVTHYGKSNGSGQIGESDVKRLILVK